jgi:hypothetical protein
VLLHIALGGGRALAGEPFEIPGDDLERSGVGNRERDGEEEAVEDGFQWGVRVEVPGIGLPGSMEKAN